MRIFTILVTIALFFNFTNLVRAQNSTDTLKKKSVKVIEPNLQKGKSRIAIHDFSVGYMPGYLSGSIGISYGYFFANNKLLLMNINVSSCGHDYSNLGLLLNYRQYFSPWKIKPFVQAGAGINYGNCGGFKSIFGYGSLGSGASVQVKKFGFEAGLQLDYNDRNMGDIHLKPLFGVSFTF